MKTLHIIIMGVLIPMFILGNTAGGGVSWFSAPKAEPNGWYWMYDDTESGPPFDAPALAPLPTFQDITADGNKLAPYSDDPFKYLMPDSFWYYGSWYTNENPNYLYISPDGWVSFDPAAAAGFPTPPGVNPPFPVSDAPNAIIAPLWQDMNPTQSPEPSDTNRVYYKYQGLGGSRPPGLYVQWHKTQGDGNTNTYDFELHLNLGGQMTLLTQGACGVVFSYHFIHFMYNTASAGWTADNGKTGIENYTGDRGIYYQGNLADGRRIRAGYKRIFKNDVMVTRFLSPASTVLRWTEIEPKVEVANVGQETESFSVTIDVYDETNDSLVYRHTVSGFNLLPGQFDTLVGPCWTPGELTTPDTHSYLKVAYTMLGRDLCKHNDTLPDISIVHCDGWLTHHWNPADFPNAAAVYMSRLGTSYDISGGTYVLGGRVFIGWWDGSVYPTPPRIEVWQAQNGCGAVPNGSYALGGGNYDGFVEALKWHEVIFDAAVWCPAGDPGNFWIAVCHPTDAGGTYMGWVPDWNLFWPDPSACYNMDYDPGRSGYWYAPTGGPSSDFNWGGYPNAPHHTHPIQPLTHLGFSPMPAPPCYYDAAHDLTCYRMEDPSGEYVEADVAITPKLAIANIGLQPEPDADFFDVKFIVVNEQTLDTVFNETSMIGGPFNQGDTTFGTTLPWEPEGLCADSLPFVYYELIGLVCLGEVGPDLTDHCPYNDTVRNHVMCLWSHDVGVIDMTWPEPPDEPPDHYDEGSKITVTATVENFGFHAERDVEVRLEVLDLDSNGVELWHALKSIDFLDWRGNAPGNPYTIDVTFPTYTVLTDRHHFCITCRTELEDDECPDNDFEVRCSPGIVEGAGAFPECFSLEIPSSTISAGCQIRFAVPHRSLVKLDVFDVGGRWVCSLENDVFEPGRHSCSWDRCDACGRKVAAGIYLIRMEADEFKDVRKIVIIN